MTDKKKVPIQPKPLADKPVNKENVNPKTRTYSDIGGTSKNRYDFVDTSTVIKKGTDSNALSTKDTKGNN